jgi:hypothetical protein
VKRSQLLPGDVVFPMDPSGQPWVVAAWEEGRMLYLAFGIPTWWEEGEDHTFHPDVLIVRGGQAVNGRFP